MSILIGRDTRLIVQGITGREGEFHSRAMLEYGTPLVGGVTPGKGGLMAIDGQIPVVDTVARAVEATGANTSCIFVPAAGAWGRQGCTRIHLADADEPTVRSAVITAWERIKQKPPARPRKRT